MSSSDTHSSRRTRINVAVIGYGLSARLFHVPFILALGAEFNLHTIVQRNPDDTTNSTAASASADYPDVIVHTTPEPMLRDPDVNLVVITTPPETHFDLALMALLSRKHVLVEKPLVRSSADALELGRVARAQGCVLSVYQNRRWDADFVTLRELVEEGRLGRIVEVATHFDRHRPEAPAPEVRNHVWMSDQSPPANGALYDLGTHLIDQVFKLWGMPIRVTGFLGQQRAEGEVSGEWIEPGDADSFTVLLHYADGKTVTAKAGVISPDNEPLRFWVRGTEGSYKKCFLDCQEAHLLLNIWPYMTGFGVESEHNHGSLTQYKDGQITSQRFPTKSPPPTYLAFYMQLALAIAGEAAVPVPAEEAALVLRIIELVIESSETRRTVDVVVSDGGLNMDGMSNDGLNMDGMSNGGLNTDGVSNGELNIDGVFNGELNIDGVSNGGLNIDGDSASAEPNGSTTS